MTTPLQPQMIETAVEVVVDRRLRSASYSGLIETPRPQRTAGVGVASLSRI
jgi:hypothetical protein